MTTRPLISELARIPQLADLPEEDLRWLADRCEILELEPGEDLLRIGDRPDWMYFLLEGELHAVPESQARDAGRLYVMRAGEITGMLPFSRMKRIPRRATAAAPTRIAAFPAARIPDLLERIPALEPRLVAILADRVRQTTQIEQQGEKLASLGKLAAGLAHELNNPAAAARRAASALRATLSDVEVCTIGLTGEVGPDQMARLLERRAEIVDRPAHALSTLQRGDVEERLGEALTRLGVNDPWRLAPSLADGGLDAERLDSFLVSISPGARGHVVRWLESYLRAAEMLRTLEEAAERISMLVHAVKQYTYMDSASLQEVDVHEGLNSTLRILSNQLEGVRIERQYAPDLPRIQAHGAELNQVWTNILDNAAAALHGSGEIVIRTWRAGENVCVEIRDSGPGMTPEVAARAFDPFFSTKGVGQGTGLGLDIARRIVEQHQGVIDVDSRPGATSFRVELPIVPATRERG